MDDDDGGEVMCALQLAQVAEHGADFAGLVARASRGEARGVYEDGLLTTAALPADNARAVASGQAAPLRVLPLRSRSPVARAAP